MDKKKERAKRREKKRAEREAAFDAREESKARAAREARAAAARREQKRRAKVEAQKAAAGSKYRSAPPPPPAKPTGRAAHLSVLGVKEDTPAAIRSAYRRLVLLFHPDKNPAPDAPAKFRQVQAAYEALTGSL